jgi:menaquinol-cytochrome c reductase iron-sulfur subunit
MTGRRGFLRWAVHGLGAIVAVVVGAPALAYLLDPVVRWATKKGEGSDENFTDVAKLSELPLNGAPREFIVRETRRDGWTLYPEMIVGRVFLMRQRSANGQEEIKAFTTTCPHLGCSVNYTGNPTPDSVTFQCPCHGARFKLNGQRVDPEHNVAPRNMDALAVRRKPDEPETIQVAYKNYRPNNPVQVEIK